MGETYACSLCDKENKIGSFAARITGDAKNEAVKGKFALICRECGDKVNNDHELFDRMIKLVGQYDRSLLVDYNIAASNLKAESWMLASKLKKEYEDYKDEVLS
ncbi:hypothetical protein ACFL6B_04065 [Thermodesulfobacteriota bacterium]